MVKESDRLAREARDAAGAQDDLAGSLGRTGGAADETARSFRELVDAQRKSILESERQAEARRIAAAELHASRRTCRGSPACRPCRNRS